MITVSITQVLTIAFIVIYQLLEWYTVELYFEAVRENKEYVPKIPEITAIENEDGTKDYSPFYAAELEEKSRKKRESAQVSIIEGTEAESLLSTLQQELNEMDSTHDEFAMPFLEEALDNEYSFPTEEPLIQYEDDLFLDVDKVELHNEKVDQQERIYELREKLNHFSREEADMEDLESMIHVQYELARLEGRYKQMHQLEHYYPMYFQTPISDSLRTYDEDVLTMQDMKMENPKVIEPISTEYVTHRVADNFLGSQIWRGVVLGKCNGFVHFSDGSRRVWIKLGGKIKNVKLNNELLLEVVKSEDGIKVNKVMRLAIKDLEQSQSKIACQ